MSTEWDAPGTDTARWRMARAKPVSSGTVSPFMRKAIISALIWESVAPPLMMQFIASNASSCVKSSRLMTLEMNGLSAVRFSGGRGGWLAVRTGMCATFVRKFSTITRPQSVRMDSGWNCTP